MKGACGLFFLASKEIKTNLLSGNADPSHNLNPTHRVRFTFHRPDKKRLIIETVLSVSCLDQGKHLNVPNQIVANKFFSCFTIMLDWL